jgi:WD40 repeat protein
MRIFDLPGTRHVPDALQHSPDGRCLAIQAFGRVEVLDTTTGAVRPVCPPASVQMGTAGVGFSADCRGVVRFDNKDQSVHAFDLETDQDRVLRPSQKVPWRSHGDAEISVVQPDGKLVFVAVTPEEGTVEIVALDTGSGEQKFAFARHRGYLRELAVSPDGQWVAGCSTKDLRVWPLGGRRLPNRASWRVEDRKQYCIGNLALARDGAYLAAGGCFHGGPLQVWDLKAGAELDLGGYGGGGVAFAPDRPLLAFTQQTGDVGEVVFWDAQPRSELRRFDWGLGPIGAVAFSLDGFRCATAGRTKVVVWDVGV